uniref:Uncharacterized protein n=1 Tax=Lactuca sativa TaxID=4236 RepID=A0A9R1WRC0_LACSA|nr:hypothetical protein LSAT_V11C900498230 [Lactuca sativa]
MKILFENLECYNKRCITLGTGLLSSESIESYSWLLHAFKNAFHKKPNVIVTSNVIQDIDCVCHTYHKNLLTGLLGSHMAKLKKLSDLIWNETILKEDFESTWKNLIDEFHLNENNLV